MVTRLLTNLLEVLLSWGEVRSQRWVTLVCHCPFTVHDRFLFYLTDLRTLRSLLPWCWETLTCSKCYLGLEENVTGLYFDYPLWTATNVNIDISGIFRLKYDLEGMIINTHNTQYTHLCMVSFTLYYGPLHHLGVSISLGHTDGRLGSSV